MPRRNRSASRISVIALTTCLSTSLKSELPLATGMPDSQLNSL